jgi:hypothetical protein
MQPRRITPEAALDLMEKQGYVYVDVRSIPEFAQGHPEGAYNVPLQHLGPAGMTPNPDFMSVMQKAFPRDALVLGCKAEADPRRRDHAAVAGSRTSWTSAAGRAPSRRGLIPLAAEGPAREPGRPGRSHLEELRSK